MVTVTGYNERQRKDGTTFIALEISTILFIFGFFILLYFWMKYYQLKT